MERAVLSYQHGYHAGNLADVHKHVALAAMLARLTAKDKPLSYLETHAGRGLYMLDAPEALKTGEAMQGIGRVTGWFGDDHPYGRVLAATRERFGAKAYPGSPLVAALSLREGDRIDLAELHPQEVAALRRTMAPFNARIHARDGVEMALALTPPDPRRGVMLIDPSYEVRTDYAAMARLVGAVHRRWNVGVLMLWFPILADAPYRPMVAELTAMDLPKALCHEVRFAPARAGHRMIGSGLYLVNAPFGLDTDLAALTAHFSTL